MIITCPHCRTKYQVTYEAIGSAGRKVQCAHCRRDWDQQPVPSPENVDPAIDQADVLFDAMAEDGLDEAMAQEAAAVAVERSFIATPRAVSVPEAPKPAKPALSPTEMRKQQAAFSRRQNAMSSRLPLARLRRAARILGLLTLFGMVGGAYLWRTAIVERFPDLAGVYAAMGLGVNVVGLDFANLQTLRSLSNGRDMLFVSAQIVGQSPEPVVLPPVVVSLLDASGHAVYEWSVLPRVRDLMAGERATFDTRLTLPPGEAVGVRLSFAGAGFSQSEPVAALPAAETPAEPPTPVAETPAPADHHEPAAAAPAHH